MAMRNGVGTITAVVWLVVGVSCSGAVAAERVAQLGPTGPGGKSYGYQPYNDRNPTGFYHPNGTGYGSYYLTQKYHGQRFRALDYRKFRGS